MADEALLRMVKDAVDHGVPAPHKASREEAELAADGMRLPASMAKGRERLTALVVGREAEWSALPSTKKHTGTSSAAPSTAASTGPRAGARATSPTTSTTTFGEAGRVRLHSVFTAASRSGDVVLSSRQEHLPIFRCPGLPGLP